MVIYEEHFLVWVWVEQDKEELYGLDTRRNLGGFQLYESTKKIFSPYFIVPFAPVNHHSILRTLLRRSARVFLAY